MTDTISSSTVSTIIFVGGLIGLVCGLTVATHTLNVANTLVPKDSDLHREICDYVDVRYRNDTKEWFNKVRALNCENDLGVEGEK